MEWDIDGAFEDNEFNQSPLNRAKETILKSLKEVIEEMIVHCSLNENSQIDAKANYCLGRLATLLEIGKVEDDPDLSEDEIEAILKDVELRSEKLNYMNLFNPDGEDVKTGIDATEYLSNKNGDDDPFDFGE